MNGFLIKRWWRGRLLAFHQWSGEKLCNEGYHHTINAEGSTSVFDHATQQTLTKRWNERFCKRCGRWFKDGTPVNVCPLRDAQEQP